MHGLYGPPAGVTITAFGRREYASEELCKCAVGTAYAFRGCADRFLEDVAYWRQICPGSLKASHHWLRQGRGDRSGLLRSIIGIGGIRSRS